MSEGNDEIAKALLTATLSALLAKVRSGDATAADLNVAMQAVKAMGIEMIPTKGNAAGQLRKALTDKLPFAGSPDAAH